MPRSGRPSKFDEAIATKIVELVKAGNYVETACASAGLSRDTCYRWWKRGARESKGPFHDFAQQLDKAMGDAEAADVLRIGKAAGEDWRAAAWRLERRNPKRWAVQVQVNVREELEDGIRRLEQRFGDRPQLLREALAALTGAGSGGPGTLDELGQLAAPTPGLDPARDEGLQRPAAPVGPDGRSGEGGAG
jgi:transposase